MSLETENERLRREVAALKRDRDAWKRQALDTFDAWVDEAQLWNAGMAVVHFFNLARDYMRRPLEEYLLLERAIVLCDDVGDEDRADELRSAAARVWRELSQASRAVLNADDTSLREIFAGASVAAARLPASVHTLHERNKRLENA